MKNSTFLFLSILLSFPLLAQENLHLESDIMDTRFYETDKIPIVKGQLLNYSPKKHKELKIEYRLTSLEEWEIKKKAVIQPDGQFELELTKTYPYQEIFIYIENYYNGTILANEDLHINIDLKKLKRRAFRNIKGVQLDGRDAGFSNYYSRFLNYQEKTREEYYKGYRSITLDRKSPNKIRRQRYLENYKLWDKRVADYIKTYPSKYASLYTFPNKSIILDVWTTWCGSCIYDMKNSTETKKALKDLPVEIVYLGVEDYSNQKKWTKTIADLKVAGHHIFLERKLAKSVMNFFNLSGYPSYIFIDKNGKWDTRSIYSISNLKIHKLKKQL